jgi:hypothetical protein
VSRDEHGFDCRSAGGVGLGLVDLVERVPADEPVEREPVLLPQADQARDEQPALRMVAMAWLAKLDCANQRAATGFPSSPAAGDGEPHKGHPFRV